MADETIPPTEAERKAKKAAQQRAYRASLSPEKLAAAKAREATNARARRQKNPERVRAWDRSRHERDQERRNAIRRVKYAEDEEWREKAKADAARWAAENPERVKANGARRRAEKGPELNQKTKEWYANNREKHAVARRKWHVKNRGRVNANLRRKMAEDINFRLGVRLRVRLGMALRSQASQSRILSAVNDLGCSLDEFREYIAAQFQPGMSWDNWGIDTWHLDHKRPLASFDLTDPEQLRIAIHFSNYQPLWAKDNLRKGARTVEPLPMPL